MLAKLMLFYILLVRYHVHMGQMSTMSGCRFDIADGAFVCCLLAKVSMRSSLDPPQVSGLPLGLTQLVTQVGPASRIL